MATLIMVVVLGINATRHSNVLWQNTSSLYNNSYKVNMSIREIERDIIAMSRSFTRAIATENEVDFNRNIYDLEQAKGRVNSNFKIVYESYLGSKASVDSANKAFADWDLIRDSSIILWRDGKFKEARVQALLGAEANEALMMKGINNLESAAMKRADGFYVAAEVKKDEVQIQSLIIWIFRT